MSKEEGSLNLFSGDKDCLNIVTEKNSDDFDIKSESLIFKDSKS